MSRNRQWVLRARPPGEVSAEHFENGMGGRGPQLLRLSEESL